MRTTNGGVEVAIPTTYNARLETGTVNGGMDIGFPVTIQGKINRRLTTQLGSGGPLVRVTTTNGGVTGRDVAGSLLKIDEFVARDTARRLAEEEGIFVGLSAGGTVAGALEVAKNANKGDVILAMLPDTGERYFSTILFEGVNEGSDDEWLAGL
mgnify:CR=1 FL=1